VRLGPGVETVGIGVLSSRLGGTGPLATPSWVNTGAFHRAWVEIRTRREYEKYDWVVKVDPDTVLLPGVLRRHLKDRYQETPISIYLDNCPAVPNGFYGSIEVVSRLAVHRFFESMDGCARLLPYHEGWGEDLFNQKCMDYAGVGHAGDWDLVLDGNCHGPGMQPEHCAAGKAAYHPLKSAAAWSQCWSEATSGGSPSWQPLPQQPLPQQPLPQKPQLRQRQPPQEMPPPELLLSLPDVPQPQQRQPAPPLQTAPPLQPATAVPEPRLGIESQLAAPVPPPPRAAHASTPDWLGSAGWMKK